MIKTKYDQGRRAALAHLKLGNMQQGAAGYNPMLTGQAGTSPPGMQPPAPASPAMAAGAPKAKVLG
jgi:hypothetical protein